MNFRDSFGFERVFGEISLSLTLTGESPQGTQPSEALPHRLKRRKRTEKTKMRQKSILTSKLTALMMMCAASSSPMAPRSEAAAQSQAVISFRNLTFERTVHDFGEISEKSGPQTCTFKFRNSTNVPIVVQKVTVSCSCTKVEWSDKPVKPGEAGEIKVEFSNRIGPGRFDKSISVSTSSTPRQIQLRVQGVVTEKTGCEE